MNELRERLAAWRATWPHPLRAGLKRKTGKTKIVGFGASTIIGLTAYAATDVLPEGDMKVVTILVGVLAALGALIVVITKTMGEALATLGKYIPRKNERNGEPASPGPDVAVNGDRLTRIETQLEALQRADRELRDALGTARVEAQKDLAAHRRELMQRIDEHQDLAMQFLADKTQVLASEVTRQVTQGLGAARDDLRQAVALAVRDAMSEAGARGAGSLEG